MNFPLYLTCLKATTIQCGVIFNTCAWFYARGECYTHEAPAEGALDPNEKLVIAERYIQPDQLLVYPIHFENIGTIEARDIFITDVLDTNLDLSTLKLLTPDGDVFLDSSTRTLRWELLNRDLLPGETDNVLLSIKPLPGLPSGTEIRNDATIQFEVFDPFTTNEVVNIIDTTRPVGVMDPLPAETSTLDFQISCSGTDAVGEIDYYTVLVSEDGGDFTPFVERTSETSAIFTGESGKTYGFICIAVDTAGNIEIQEDVAETATHINIFSDDDNDGVPNSTDICQFTAIGAVVDPATGCSISQLCPCSAPCGTTTAWKNHGQYVSCVAKSSENFVLQGLMTETQKGFVVSQAANSLCGSKK